jgi:predicted transcriptional regulator
MLFRSWLEEGARVPRFGDLEEAIMDRVWAAEGPVRVRDVLEDLQRDREIAYTTVQTVMEILRRKGWLERQKDGRAHRYWATASRADYTAQLMDEALSGSSDPGAALVRFVERMDAGEVAQLRAALEQARGGSA